MFIVFHRSDLRISVKIVHLVVDICIIPYFILMEFAFVLLYSMFMNVCRNFADIFRELKKSWKMFVDVLPTFADISSNVRTGVNSSF